MWRCAQLPKTSDPARRHRAPGMLLAACLLLAGAVSAQETVPPPPDRRAVQNRQEAFRKLEKSHPGVKPSDLWDFYKQHAPDRIQEFERACKTSSSKSLAALVEMTDRYLELEELREQNPQEYKRLVELEEFESQARDLGRRITALAKSSANPQDVGHKSLLETRQLLREVLEKCFERSQQNQLLELNRLEAEVRDLRALLQQRQGARELILQQRFLDLSGMAWEERK